MILRRKLFQQVVLKECGGSAKCVTIIGKRQLTKESQETADDRVARIE